ILHGAIDPKQSDQRLRIVRLCLQMERFQDARQELEQLVKDFPSLDLNDQVKTLRRLSAEWLIKEIELREEAGQWGLAFTMLKQFPAEGVPGETLLKVRELLDEFPKINALGEKV